MHSMIGKCLILCIVILIALGFGYHLYHNLRQAHGGSGTETAAPARGR